MRKWKSLMKSMCTYSKLNISKMPLLLSIMCNGGKNLNSYDISQYRNMKIKKKESLFMQKIQQQKKKFVSLLIISIDLSTHYLTLFRMYRKENFLFFTMWCDTTCYKWHFFYEYFIHLWCRKKLFWMCIRLKRNSLTYKVPSKILRLEEHKQHKQLSKSIHMSIINNKWCTIYILNTRFFHTCM